MNKSAIISAQIHIHMHTRLWFSAYSNKTMILSNVGEVMKRKTGEKKKEAVKKAHSKVMYHSNKLRDIKNEWMNEKKICSILLCEVLSSHETIKNDSQHSSDISSGSNGSDMMGKWRKNELISAFFLLLRFRENHFCWCNLPSASLNWVDVLHATKNNAVWNLYLKRMVADA